MSDKIGKEANTGILLYYSNLRWYYLGKPQFFYETRHSQEPWISFHYLLLKKKKRVKLIVTCVLTLGAFMNAAVMTSILVINYTAQ